MDLLALAICLETTYPGCNGEHPWRMASVAVILVSVGLIALTLGCRLRGAESHAGVAEVVTGSEGKRLRFTLIARVSRGLLFAGDEMPRFLGKNVAKNQLNESR